MLQADDAVDFSILEALFRGLKPDPVMKVSEWSDTFRILPDTSAEPGLFRTSRTPYLKEIMDKLSVSDPAQKIIWKKSSQVGAALSLDTPLPTPSGWTTMGDVKVGDLLFDERGCVCRVTFCTDVMTGHKCFHVNFSDGSTVLADIDHRWEVIDYKHRKHVLTTDQILKKYKVGNRNIYGINTSQPLQIEDVELPIPPYALGVWLGDGNSHSNRITVFSEDANEICAGIKKEGIPCDIVSKHSKGNCTEIVLDPKRNDICKRGHIFSQVGTINGRCRKCHNQRSNYYQRNTPMDPVITEKSTFSKIVSLGISPIKRIPEVYLRASITQRMNLIRGLMDTDGYASKSGRCEFTTVSEEIARSFFELVVSVGLKPIINKKVNKIYKIINGQKCQTKGHIFSIHFVAYRENSVFNLTRKTNRLNSMVNGRPSEVFNRKIVSIVPADSVPVKCITVDSPSHLYLCGKSMIPTHNTESGNNWLGYTIHIAPTGMLYIMPTDTMMKTTSKTRIKPMIEKTPEINAKIKPARSRDSGNTMLTKEFEGGFVNMVGANSPVGLASLAVRQIYCDEVDRYPDDVGGEGDVIDLAETRTTTYGSRRKIFISSTPTVDGKSIIDREYQKTGQRHFHVPCPHCGTYQHLKFEQLRYEKGKYQPGDVQYECEHCHELIHERFKTRMLSAGMWIADFPERENNHTFGYHINGLYSPDGWYSWARMAMEYEDAVNDLPKLIVWTNTKKGECYAAEGDAPAWESVYNKREPNMVLNRPNDSVVFITAGVDVQRDRIEIEIVGWGKGKESWSIDYRVLVGDASSADNEVWKELDKIVSETWIREDGAVLPLSLMAVDSGNNTAEVYAWCRRHPISQVVPIKGRDGMAIMVSQPRQVDTSRYKVKIEGGTQVWSVGVSLIKSEFYGWLKLQKKDNEPYPAGYCHFPMYDEHHFRSLTAENVEYVKDKKGYTKPAWVKNYERNERLDCRVYARAAAFLIGIDLITPEKWDELLIDTKDLIPQNNVVEKSKPKRRNNDFWGGR